MLYAFQDNEIVVVSSATSFLEFEEYKATVDEIVGAEVKLADILDLLTDPMLSGFKAAPLIIECESIDRANEIIKTFHEVTPNEARDMHDAMLEEHKLSNELGGPNDRRPVGEVHGLTENDPWQKVNPKKSEQNKAIDDAMKKAREAGVLSGDSFGGSSGEGIRIGQTTVTVDKDGNVTGVDVMATKDTMTAYEIVTVDDIDFEDIFDVLRIPENRIEEQSENRAVVRLHSFQISQVSALLEERGINHTMSRVAEEGEVENLVDGHAAINVFFSVQIEGAQVAAMMSVIQDAGIDESTIASMRDFDSDCWFMCPNETDAEAISKALEAAGHHNVVVAVNRRGQAILGEGANARVVDTNKKIVIEPRPWNDQADQIDALSEEDRKKLFKGIKASEFSFALVDSPKYRTVVYITPTSYFKEHEKAWEGDMPILDLVPENFLKHIEGNAYQITLEKQLAKDNLIKFGFVENLMFHIYLNEIFSDQMAERSL